MDEQKRHEPVSNSWKIRDTPPSGIVSAKKQSKIVNFKNGEGKLNLEQPWWQSQRHCNHSTDGLWSAVVWRRPAALLSRQDGHGRNSAALLLLSSFLFLKDDRSPTGKCVWMGHTQTHLHVKEDVCTSTGTECVRAQSVHGSDGEGPRSCAWEIPRLQFKVWFISDKDWVCR